jgi:hypothetical protein
MVYRPNPNSEREKVMTRLAMIVVTLLFGLSACHAGFSLGDSGQHPAYVATDALESAGAQASTGTVLPTGD